MRPALFTALLFLTPLTTQAQWQLQDAHITADLRGIDSVGNGSVAWASGTNGTVLRTEDAGFVWQLCAIPPNAEHLDFRAIQAFDNNTALVMSSGKGDQSRLYKTTDGCQTWTLLFTNPDKDGFWDALRFDPELKQTWILGDPVQNHFRLFESDTETRLSTNDAQGPSAQPLQAAFAASNSILLRAGSYGSIGFVTGGSRAEFIWSTHGPGEGFAHVALPFVQSESSGAFSIAAAENVRPSQLMVVVGGDYKNPNSPQQTAAVTRDGGQHWLPAATLPHGYRSAVAYDPTHNLWITVGPNGTDISTDDGRNWRPLKPSPGEALDTDQHWNALSLPYAVGPHGRIGSLNPNALPTPAIAVGKK